MAAKAEAILTEEEQELKKSFQRLREIVGFLKFGLLIQNSERCCFCNKSSSYW